ncbi:MAG: hypothetical protein HY200_01435 [Nitrospirae bacterium]|nr:hypothetical protein [Nitrospirota bacterium]MBI3593599.1 hypothetical protein [Nitrospirota bacterium]
MKTSSLPLVILGGGFTGKVIFHQAVPFSRPLLITSRNPAFHLQSFHARNRIWFDLENPKSWDSLPEKGDVIWTFPANSPERIEQFIVEKGDRFNRLVVIGSTSAYRKGSSKESITVDENSPVNPKDSRIIGEGLLREKLNGIILRSAGIYGPGRNPVDWIRKGRLKHSPRFINLIHVEDLSALSLLALSRGKPGDVYNVSDGNPVKVSDLVETARTRWHIPVPPLSKEFSAGQKVSNLKMIETFNYSIQFSDLYSVLDKLQKEDVDPV